MVTIMSHIFTNIFQMKHNAVKFLMSYEKNIRFSFDMKISKSVKEIKLKKNKK